MIRYPNLIPECNVDTAFVEMMGFPSPNHAPSITQVCTIMEKEKSGKVLVGFIDDDKKKPLYLQQFELVQEVGGIEILKHHSKNQYMVVAKPAMDKLIYELCNTLGINLSGYRLPVDFAAFLKCTKRQSIKNDNQFRNLLNTIKQKNPQEVQVVRNLLSKLFN